MGHKHSRVYVSTEKESGPTENYPIVKSNLFLLDFDVLKQCRKFPGFEQANLTTSLNKIDLDESFIIFISHVWLTELSSIPGVEDFAHPDTRNNDKCELCIAGVQKIIDTMCTDKVKKVYLWIDYCCAPSPFSMQTCADVLIDKAMAVADIIFTPIVDHDCNQWDLPAGAMVDLRVDYKAEGWVAEKGYLGRAWNRAEMFLGADVPLLEDPHLYDDRESLKRADMFSGELCHYLRQQQRPHLLFGTKELRADAAPHFLPPIASSQYPDFDPLKGYFPIEAQRPLLSQLVDQMQRADPRRSSTSPMSRDHWKPVDKEDKYGTRVYPSGARYKGEWLDGLREGKGKMTFPNGNVYEGDWREDAMCGTGVMRYANGSIYIGKWQGNCRHGQGILQAKQWGGDAFISEYNGTWYLDKQYGWGMTTVHGLEEHEGEYRNNERHGPGVLRDPQKNILFDGAFQRNLINGYGVRNYPNGDVYSGHFKSGLRHGKGRLLFANNDLYEGDFYSDKMEGEGTMSTETESYQGNFLSGHKHGQGEIAFANGDLFSGKFENNNPKGHGVMTYANGRKVPLYDGRKKRLCASCMMLGMAAVVIVATDVLFL